jgi:DNA-binding transcriptional ArsR family regulator
MDDNLDILADLFKALADTTRLRLVQLLLGQTIIFCSGDCNGQPFLCVGALANKLKVSQSAVSQHLRILKQAGLVKGERRGSFMHYSIDPDGIGKFRSMVAQTMGDKLLSA